MASLISDGGVRGAAVAASPASDCGLFLRPLQSACPTKARTTIAEVDYLTIYIVNPHVYDCLVRSIDERLSVSLRAVRIKLGPDQPAPQPDPLGRDRIGYLQGLDPFELWERGRGVWKAPAAEGRGG